MQEGFRPLEKRGRWSWGKFVVPVVMAVFCFVISPGAEAQQGGSIVGRWQYKGAQQEIVTDFKADGTFHQITKTASGQQEFRGRYDLSGQLLRIQPEGYAMAQQILCRFQDGDTMVLAYQTGETIQAKRVKSVTTDPGQPSKSQPSNPPSLQLPEVAPSTSAASASGTSKPMRVFLQRVWEPNEKAFTVLVPKGWKTTGGIFNVNPLKMNGPGNTLSPKCDFAVRNDDRGSVMIHWMPSWNYADLTYSPTGYGLFQPGQYYQGMLVKPVLNAKQFLTELLSKERPQASSLRVIAEDPMTEVSVSFAKQAEQINAGLRKLGIAPLRFESLAMLVEYAEGGQRYQESLMTTIADNRAGAFQWSNENTIMFRAPAAEFETWKPVLDMIQSSRQANPQWLASVEKASGQRAKAALETQQYINKVANEIVENRRKTNAEIRHEQWLFISGQEEYKNPFTGEIERGTSAYRYRWENNQGEILYTDENSFDPNRYEEYNTREWKRAEVWDRRK
jgi:hypothetical protein